MTETPLHPQARHTRHFLVQLFNNIEGRPVRFCSDCRVILPSKP